MVIATVTIRAAFSDGFIAELPMRRAAWADAKVVYLKFHTRQSNGNRPIR